MKMADAADMTATEAQHVVDTIVAAMGRQFESGEPVQIPSFGTFEVKKHNERVMTNPTTGQKMLVPPKLVLGFKPSTTVRTQLKKGGNV